MQTHRFAISSFLLAALGAGAAPGCAAEEGATAVPFPATCRELQGNDPSLPDAEYTLYLRNDETKPWRAHCQNMSTSTPTEYLSLRRTGGTYNFSEFVRPGGPFGPVRTSYAKLKIDPVLMQIDIGDKDHATRTGNTTFLDTPIDSMPFGVAVACGNTPALAINTGNVAAGNIDLSGTGFVIADSFCVHNTQSGHAVLSSDRGRVEFAVVAPLQQNVCAWVAPDPCPVDPWRPNTGGGLLDIEYSP